MTDHVLSTTKDIFNFLELPIQPETYKFLKEHCDPTVWKKAHVVPQVRPTDNLNRGRVKSLVCRKLIVKGIR